MDIITICISTCCVLIGIAALLTSYNKEGMKAIDYWNVIWSSVLIAVGVVIFIFGKI